MSRRSRGLPECGIACRIELTDTFPDDAYEWECELVRIRESCLFNRVNSVKTGRITTDGHEEKFKKDQNIGPA